MTVSDTSIEAYYSERRIASEQSIRVRGFIAANPDSTNEDIALGLRMRIQTVTPRVKELKECGVVWITGRTKTSAGRTAKTLRVATCPYCLSDHIRSVRRDPEYFDYHCWDCGRDFSARLGKRSDDDVEVFM